MLPPHASACTSVPPSDPAGPAYGVAVTTSFKYPVLVPPTLKAIGTMAFWLLPSSPANRAISILALPIVSRASELDLPGTCTLKVYSCRNVFHR